MESVCFLTIRPRPRLISEAPLQEDQVVVEIQMGYIVYLLRWLYVVVVSCLQCRPLARLGNEDEIRRVGRR